MDDRRSRCGREQIARPRSRSTGGSSRHRTYAQRVSCGFFLTLLGSVAGSCTANPPDPPQTTELVARIGVPEANVSTSDSGLMQVAGLLSEEGLTYRGSDGRPVGRLAQRWSSSSDGLTWQFTLHDNVTFHDGSPANANAVVQALRSAVARSNQLGLFPSLADVVSVSETSETGIEIKLKRASTFLLEDLDFSVTRRSSGKTVVGTGAFKVTRSEPGEIHMDRHEGYHQGPPAVSRVTIRAYPTLRTAWASLMRGEIDILYDLSRDAVEFVGSSEVGLYSYLRHYVYVIALNSERSQFASTTVRRALNAALDREQLIRKVLKGQGIAANGPLWPEHWAYDSALRGYGYDPSLAGATLDAAGLRVRESAGGRRTRFSFTCIVPEDWLTWARMALEVQKQLYDIGVDMQLEPLSAEEYDKRLRNSDFEAVMIELWSGPTFSRPYVFWRSGGKRTAYNVFRYRNPTADRWFDAIRSSRSDAEYRLAAGELQRTLLEDPPGLFLAWSQRTRAISRKFDVPVEPGRDPMAAFWRLKANTYASNSR